MYITSRALFNCGKNTGSRFSFIAFVLKAYFLLKQLYQKYTKSIVVSSLQSQSYTPEDFIFFLIELIAFIAILYSVVVHCVYIFPRYLFSHGIKAVLSEIVHRVYGKLLTEGFPELHSQNYSYNCDLFWNFRITLLHTEISVGGITGTAKFTPF